VWRSRHSHSRNKVQVQKWAERNHIRQLRNIPETETRLPSPRERPDPLLEDSSMFQFVIVVVALSSASIFFAHAVESYLTQ
jgi:hypothetical protein